MHVLDTPMATRRYIFICLLEFIVFGVSAQDTLCHAIITGKTLNLSFRDLPDLSASTLIHNNITNSENVQAIDLSNSNISHIDADSFRSFYNIKVLNLSRNVISCVDNTTFRTLIYLECLDLSYNNFTELLAGPYNLVRLKSLNFEHNNINFVQPGVVNNTNVYLEHFNVKYNQLKTFEPWPYLCTRTGEHVPQKYFDLSHNHIENFTNHMKWVYDLSSPYTINVLLQYNMIRTISVSQYKPKDDLEDISAFLVTFYMNITNNPYVCDCNIFRYASDLRQSLLRWIDVEDFRYRCEKPSEFAGIDWLHDLPLYNMVCNRMHDCPSNCSCQDRPHNDTFYIDCRGAGLTEIPDTIPDTNRTKIEMFLDNNYITVLKNTSYLSRLFNLSIPNNRLQVLDDSLIKRMQILSYLDVRNNQIRAIPLHFQSFPYGNIKLAGNPLHCDCNSYWLSDWASETHTGQSVTCDSDTGVHALKDITHRNLGCSHETVLVLGVIIGVMLLILLLIGLLVYRCPYETKVILQRIFKVHPWDKYKVDEEGSKDVDVYLVMDFDPDVTGWVRHLLRKLRQKKPYYKILNPYRYMEPGAEEMFIRKWILRSKRVLVILSPGIFQNHWRNYEIDVAEDNLVKAMSGNGNQGQTNKGTQSDMFDDVQVAAKLIYIFYNGTFRDELAQDPWKTRLLGKTVLMPERRMFMSKLRYELPSKGNGTTYDENFRVESKQSHNARMRELKKHIEEENHVKHRHVPAVEPLMNAILTGITKKIPSHKEANVGRRSQIRGVYGISVHDQDMRHAHATQIKRDVEMLEHKQTRNTTKLVQKSRPSKSVSKIKHHMQNGDNDDIVPNNLGVTKHIYEIEPKRDDMVANNLDVTNDKSETEQKRDKEDIASIIIDVTNNISAPELFSQSFTSSHIIGSVDKGSLIGVETME